MNSNESHCHSRDKDGALTSAGESNLRMSMAPKQTTKTEAKTRPTKIKLIPISITYSFD